MEDDPKPDEGLALLEDDDFIPDGLLSEGAGVVVGRLRIVGIGNNGDVVGVVFLVGALAFEAFHIGGLGGVGGVADDGERLSHGDPAEKEVFFIAVDISGVSSAGGEVDAASKKADVGAVLKPSRGAVFTEEGKARLADGVAFIFCASMPERDDVGVGEGLFALAAKLDFKGGEGGGDGFESVDDFLTELGKGFGGPLGLEEGVASFCL